MKWFLCAFLISATGLTLELQIPNRHEDSIFSSYCIPDIFMADGVQGVCVYYHKTKDTIQVKSYQVHWDLKTGAGQFLYKCGHKEIGDFDTSLWPTAVGNGYFNCDITNLFNHKPIKIKDMELMEVTTFKNQHLVYKLKNKQTPFTTQAYVF
jgi:hypothetical protein